MISFLIFIHHDFAVFSYKRFLINSMWSNFRLFIYALTAIAGLIWLFYYITQFIIEVQNGSVGSSVIEISRTLKYSDQ
jgi:hypothetical protein